MKVLIVTHHQLDINGGGAFASKALANAFSEIAEKVTLLYPVVGKDDGINGINSDIETIPVRYDKPNIFKFWDLLTGKVNRYGNIAPSYIQSGQFDTIVFDNSKTSFHLLDIAKKSGLRIVTVHHNFEYEFAKGNSKGIFKYLHIFWSKRYEAQACNGSDLNITLTSEDAELLSNAFTGGDRSRFAVLGIFESSQKSLPEIFDEKGQKRPVTFAITGNLSIAQTVDSLLPWLGTYYPLVKQTFPDSKLIIAGRDPDKRIKMVCAQEGIELIESPLSMDPIMSQADCYICPTDLGGGIKLRVMDGLRWGLPVIAHSVSARGYGNFASTGNLFSYDSLSTFSKALEKIKSGTNSRSKVQQQYSKEFSYSRGIERLHDILSRFGIC